MSEVTLDTLQSYCLIWNSKHINQFCSEYLCVQWFKRSNKDIKEDTELNAQCLRKWMAWRSTRFSWDTFSQNVCAWKSKRLNKDIKANTKLKTQYLYRRMKLCSILLNLIDWLEIPDTFINFIRGTAYVCYLWLKRLNKNIKQDTELNTRYSHEWMKQFPFNFTLQLETSDALLGVFMCVTIQRVE